jgi:hypothetical protein
MSKTQLRKSAILLATQLRAIHAEKQQATSDMSLRIAQLRVLSEKAGAKADAAFHAVQGECLAVGAAIAARENLQIVAREPRNVYLGSEAIISGRLSGVDPILNSASALEALAEALN